MNAIISAVLASFISLFAMGSVHAAAQSFYTLDIDMSYSVPSSSPSFNTLTLTAFFNSGQGFSEPGLFGIDISLVDVASNQVLSKARLDSFDTTVVEVSYHDYYMYWAETWVTMTFDARNRTSNALRYVGTFTYTPAFNPGGWDCDSRGLICTPLNPAYDQTNPNIRIARGVPEPASYVLALAGVMLVLTRRRFRLR